MKNFITVLAIIIGSNMAAAITAPPDAVSHLFNTGMFILWGGMSYLMGSREGQKMAHMADNKT